jgi:hypothetical protein
VQQKSTYDVWQKWAKVLVRQLDQVADVYEYHEETGEAERLNAYLDNLRLFVDPLAHAQELARRDYDVQGGVNKLYLLSLTMLQGLFREALGMMQEISEDMQRILKSPCNGNCNGRTASDIFKGPHSTQNEGIGSGIPDERGGLPWILQDLLEQAEVGGEEYFMRGLENEDKKGSGEGGRGLSGADRHQPMKHAKMVTGGGFG